MLIRFSVENFLSFKRPVVFSMVASKVTRHGDHVCYCNEKKVLKGSYVFGANASGKTNLIRAIDFAKSIVVHGLENMSLDRKYFRIESDFKNKPGVFQFDLYSDGIFYSYGFALSYIDSSIEEEWLYRLDADKQFCIFLRTKNNDGSYHVDTDLNKITKEQKERFNIYASDISSTKMKKSLFLSDIAMRSPEDLIYKAFTDVRSWFEKLIIIFPDSKYSAITELVENADEKTKLENLLKYFDTGIQSVKKERIEFDKALRFRSESFRDKIKADIENKLKDNIESVMLQQGETLIEVKLEEAGLSAYEVVSNHGNNDDLFEYRDESDGTQRLFDLIPIYQQALEGKIIIIDEIDRSLHTHVAQGFINYFYDITKNAASQLIVTTHDSNILDLDFIRQDEIWFVERQKDCSSKLYSLNAFKERFDKKIEKDYLLGRYGAIPIFNELNLMSNFEEEDSNE